MSLDEKLGRYVVLEQIGQGGMATVFLGEHELLRQQVAIKLLHAKHIHNPAMERRFHNEARAIAALDHHGIVKLFDIGRTSDGRAYVVMELLRGETLRERIGDAGISPAKTVLFARQIASAVHAAHEAGIIHRDLKPENVFIVEDADVEGGERCKILDFGIAKRTRVGTPGPITRTGILLGTPSYMAPEQCHGGFELDARADVYSLGVLMYEMLSGSLPFSSEETDELIAQQLYCAPTDLASIAPDVPANLCAVTMRCLAKEPKDRFQSMAEVGDALVELDVDEIEHGVALYEASELSKQLELTSMETWNAPLEDAVTSVLTQPSRSRFGLKSMVALTAVVFVASIGVGLAVWSHAGTNATESAASVAGTATAGADEPDTPGDLDVPDDLEAAATADVPEPAAPLDELAANLDEPVASPDEPVASPDEPVASPDEPAALEPAEVMLSKPAVEPPAKRKARRVPQKQQTPRRKRNRSRPKRAAAAEKATPPPKTKVRFDDVDTPAVF